jgi:hypothetical protein
MLRSYTYEPIGKAGRFAQRPALARLGLSDGDLDELSRQGFLAPERRNDRTYYKLRFRRACRQVVRYVGSIEEAALVAGELKELQRARRLARELNRCDRIVRQRLRKAKAVVEPQLLAHGIKFHGRAIRRSRRAANQIDVNFSALNDKEVQMNRDIEDEFIESEAEFAASLSGDEPDEADEKKLRSSRIAELAYEANRMESTARATLGGVKAGLYRMCMWTEARFDRMVQSGAADEAHAKLIDQAIDTHLEVVGEIGVIEKADARLADGERQADSLRAQSRRAAVQPPSRVNYGRDRN